MTELPRPASASRRSIAPRTALATTSHRSSSRIRNPYLAFALRWWWLLLFGAMAGAGGGYAYRLYGPVPYESTSLILVPPQTDPSMDTFGSPGKYKVAAEQYAAQAASPLIYGKVSRALVGTLDIDTNDLMQMVQKKKLIIQAVRGANMVSFTVQDQNPDTARLLANTFATVFANAINEQAASDVDERRTNLEQQMNVTRQQLTSAQLQQRQQELQKSLQDARGQLLQLQLQYQQELQRQVESERAQNTQTNAQVATAAGAGQPAAPDQPQLTPEQQQQVDRANTLAVQTRMQTLGAITARQRDAQQILADLQSQLNDVQNAIAALPPDLDADASAKQQALADLQLKQQQQDLLARQSKDRLTQLQQRMTALNQQLTAQRNQFNQLQNQYQQEANRKADLQNRLAQVDNTDRGRLNRDQRNALDNQHDSLAASIDASDKNLQSIGARQQDLQQSIADLQSQVDGLQSAINAFPPDGSYDTAQQLIMAQRDQAQAKQALDQRTQLLQRQDQLQNKIRDQRSAILGLQTQYQTELQRQADTDAKDAMTAAQAQSRAAAAQPKQPLTPADVTDPVQKQRLVDLANVTAQVRTQWLQVISDQQTVVQKTIADLTTQLAQVQDSLAKQPVQLDPALSAAFIGAYASTLQSLTNQYVRMQLNAQSTSTPVERYGEASPPLRAISLSKVVSAGTGIGMVLMTALAFLLERLLSWRRARRTAIQPVEPRDLAPYPGGGLPDGAAALTAELPAAEHRRLTAPGGRGAASRLKRRRMASV